MVKRLGSDAQIGRLLGVRSLWIVRDFHLSAKLYNRRLGDFDRELEACVADSHLRLLSRRICVGSMQVPSSRT